MSYRTNTQLPLGYHDLIVDNFAGGGGASTGIEMALGQQVDVAINHDEQAISMHTVNHPHTQHLCESVWEVDPVELCGGRSVRLAWFSPDCTHFSKAKGGKPVKKKIRGLAWVVLKWAGTVRPQVIMLENVEEFKTWGPLKGNQPCPDRKGQTFEKWKSQLQALGYQVEHRELRGCDYGAPTIRKRLFIIARCDGQPIVWPAPTHGTKGSGLKKFRTAADIIDWSIPCPSIFERKRPLADNTMRRIARGLERFVINNPNPFIVNVANSKTTGRAPNVWALEEPLRTITSSPGFALVTPFITEHANSSNPRSWSPIEPLRTQCAQVKGGHFALISPTLIQTGYGERDGQAPRVPGLHKPLGTIVAGGNKHALVAAFLAQHNLGATGHKADSPLSTITSRGTQQQIVTAHMVRQFGKSVGSSVEEPVGTVTAGGSGKTGLVTTRLQHVNEVRAFLLKYYGTNIGHDCREPLQTVTSKHRFGLVTVKGENYQIVDIGMRMLSPRELYSAQGFPDDYIIDRTADGTPITKTAQVRMCGNSVCPPVSEALVRANIVEQSEVAAA